MKASPLVAAILFGIVPSSPRATLEEPAESYALSPCAVVQLGTTTRLYITRPDSGLQAVDVATARLMWSTKLASFPLLARGDRLLALLPPQGAGWRLGILDARSGRVLVRFPVWGRTLGTVGDGLGSHTTMEVVSQDGRDIVVWRSSWHTVSGAYRKDPVPVNTSEGAAVVDLTRATLVPISDDVPPVDLKYKVNPAGGYELGPFEVDGATFIAAREFRGGRFRIVLHRTRGVDSLPDVELCDSSRVSEYVGVSADRRHILGGCQDPHPTMRNMYNVTIHSTLTGVRVGVLLSDIWPAAAVVWRSRLVSFFPERVEIVDVGTGKKVFEAQLRTLRYLGPYPPAPQRPVVPR